MTDIHDLSPLDPDAKPTEEKEINLVLAWFVERVRTRKPIGADVLSFVADGVAAHLADKAPWPTKRGRKKRGWVEELHDSFPIYTAYQRSGMAAADDLDISDDTVRRAVAAVEEARKTSSGRWVLEYLKQQKDADT